MNRMFKYAAAVGTAGMLAIGMSMPSYAAHGRNAAAAIGFGAGAVVGATAANAANNGYAYGPRYRTEAPAYNSYAYAPEAETYSSGYGAYAHVHGPLNNREQRCTLSPASINFVPCNQQ